MMMMMMCRSSDAIIKATTMKTSMKTATKAINNINKSNFHVLNNYKVIISSSNSNDNFSSCRSSIWSHCHYYSSFLLRNNNSSSSIMSIRRVTPIIARGYKNKKSPKPLKTRQSAAKRFTRTANGGLKHKHAGKAHKNISKSKTRLTRLRQTGHLQGTNLKNMRKLLMTGK